MASSKKNQAKPKATPPSKASTGTENTQQPSVAGELDPNQTYTLIGVGCGLKEGKEYPATGAIAKVLIDKGAAALKQ